MQRRFFLRTTLLASTGLGLLTAWPWAAWAGSYGDFFHAIRIDDANTVRKLLARGFDPNTPSEKNQHPLGLAIATDAFNVAQVLANERQTQIDQRNASDETPLMLAALKGELGLVKTLVARRAEVNKTGWSPLHYAASKGDVAVLRVLLDANAFIDAQAPNGTTPLMMAAMYGTPQAVKLLLDAGADPTLKNHLGLNALGFAQSQEHTRESAALIQDALSKRR